MKQSKRLISMFLAMVMFLSVISSASTVFAEEVKDEQGLTVVDESKRQEQLEYMKGVLSDFGTDIVNVLTADEAKEQYSNFFSSVSDIVKQNETAVVATGAVGDFETKVNSYAGKLKTKTPTEEDVKGYQEILADYKNLTDKQKSEIELFAENKFYVMVLDYEAYSLYAAGDKLKAAYTKANDIANAVVTDLVPVLTQATELYTKILDRKSTLTSDQKIAEFAAASFEVRAYLGLYDASYGAFRQELNSMYCGNGLVQLIISVGNDLMGDDTFTGTKPTRVSKPNPSQFEGGEASAEYQAAFNNWLTFRKETAEYDSAKNNHATKYQLQAWEKIAADVPEYKPLLQLLKDGLAAIDAFNADSSNLAPVKKVAAEMEKLTDFQKVFIKNNPMPYFRTDVENQTTDWKTTVWSSAKIYEVLSATAQYDSLTAFLAVIDGMKAPYTNDMIIKVKDAYSKVPDYFKLQIPAEVMAKYKDILASITFDAPSLEKPDLTAFNKTVVTYPEKVTHDQVEKALPRIESILTDVLLPILGVEGSLTDMITTGVYTNSAIAEICKTLYPMMGGLDPMLAGLATPSALSSALFEDKYVNAVAALKDVKGDLTKLTFKNGDMGFQDGDKEGFLNAFADLFRPFVALSGVFQFENKIDTVNGTYTYGIYEDLVPIFEALDLKDYMSSHEYTLYVNKVYEDYKDQTAARQNQLSMAARVRAILVPIFNLIDTVAAEPLDTLLDILPKFGYLLKDNYLNNQINMILAKGSVFGNPLNITVDLTAGGLFGMIAPMLENLTIGEGESATTISIKLDKDKFIQFVNDIGGCGTAVSKDSVARGTAYRLGIDSDKPDSFVVLFRWLYGEITTKENITSIKSAVDSSTLGTAPKFIVKALLSSLSEKSADEVLTSLINIIAPSFPNIDDLLPGNDDNNNDDGNNNNSNENPDITKNPDIPKTGAKIFGVLASAFAVTAAGAVVAVKMKKKED